MGQRGAFLRTLGLAAAAALLLANSAAATTIQYQLIDLGGGQFRALYTLSNDGTLGDAVQGFDIYFAPALYLESSLQIATPSPLADDWDELILGSGVLVSAAYDALALAGGVPDGGSQSGFAVQFDWIGSGAPGAQPFEIFDVGTFAVLESGITMPIPEPSTFSLVMLGTAILLRKRRIHD